MDEICVSVSCLAYNHEKYIRSALEGFISQKTKFKYEVIIHDDASTDKTADIIKEYEKKYPDIIKPIYQKENQYSKGINIFNQYIYPKTRGKYIAYCEGDDFWTDNYKLQKQFDFLEKHPESSICVHRVNCLNEDGSPNNRTIPEKEYGINKDAILSQKDLCELYWLKGGYPFHTSSYMIKKEVLLKYPGFKRDKGILFKGLLDGDALYIDTPMSARRLMTVGNFNSRLKADGNKGMVKLCLQDLENESTLKKYSNCKFDDYIKYGMFNKIMYISSFDPELSKELLKKYDLCFRKSTRIISGNKKIKLWIKYILFVSVPEKVYIKINSLHKKLKEV